MIPGVTVDPALTAALLATIPADIVASMSPQMREVMAIQATRADECRRAGEEFAAAAGDLSPAARSLAAHRAEYRAERTLWNEGGPTMARTDDHHIRTAGVDVPIRIHRPTTEAVLPGLLTGGRRRQSGTAASVVGRSHSGLTIPQAIRMLFGRR